MKHLKILLQSLLGIAVVFFVVTPSLAVTINEIIELALANDAQLKAEILEAEAVNADGWRAVGEYGSNLYISGSYKQSRDSSTPDRDSEVESRDVDFNESELTLGFEQPLIDIEKVNIAKKGLVMMDMAELQIKKASEELILKTHERYYALLSSSENLRLAKAESAALLNQLENAKTKLELGFGTITDQYNAEARYRLSIAEEVSRKTAVVDALFSLEEIINQELIEQVEDLDENTPLPILAKSEDEWLILAQENNSELSIKTFQHNLSRLQYQAAKSRFLPALVFFADYNERNPSDSLIGYGENRRETDVGVKLDIDLLSGGRDSAQAVAASKRTKAARELKNVSERSVKRSIRSLWESIHNTEQLVGAYQMAVEANRLAMESTEASYDEGVKVLLDVLNAQQDYFRSLREYKTSRYEYMMLLERFKHVVGMRDIT